MVFVGISKFEKPIPGRLYVHSVGLELVFNDDINSAINYGINFLKDNRQVRKFLEEYKYAFGIVYGDAITKEPALDIFGYRNIIVWPGNPDFNAWTFRNGVYVTDSDLACEDEIILLGYEAQYRRTKRNLNEYLNESPNFPESLGRLDIGK